MASERQNRVLILQRILPPYRLAFFQRLSGSSSLDVTVAYGIPSRDSALESIADPDGVQYIPVQNTYIGKNEMVVRQTQTVDLVKSGQFDAVIAEFSPRIVTNIMAYRAAMKQGIPFLWWGHGIRPRSSEITIQIYLWMCKGAAAVIVYTQDCANKLINRGILPEKIFVAWNSIDTSEIELLSKPFSAHDRTSILCIGRLIAEKNVGLLIKAFKMAMPRLPDTIMLEIIGEGPELPKLEALACKLDLRNRVKFAHSIYDQTELAPIFNRSLVSVSAGYVGLSAMHSLAFGVPMLVADDEPHSPEIVAIEEGVNSFLFKAGSTESLADLLVSSIADPDRLTQMSAAGRETIAKRFSISAMVSGFEAAVKYACDQPAK